jgi:hypothetical protein
MNGNWLLCDFHIHTTFSDGELPLAEVIDLYGRKAFDVIGISDHILDETSWGRYSRENPPAVTPERFPEYLHVLWRETRRAWETYRMLVMPGVEITNDTQGYHILAIDIKDYVEPGQPVEAIVNQIHEQGAIAVAPHPHRGSLDGTQQLMYLWNNRSRFAHLFDAWEVANRDDLFNVVGLKKFNYVANSDFHQPRHLYSWKTLLHCDKNPEAVKAAIRQNEGVSIYLLRADKPLAENGSESPAPSP